MIAVVGRAMAVVLVLAASGCFSAARTDARVTPGGEVGLAVSGYVMPRGVDDEGRPAETQGGMQLQLDLQYGAVSEGGGAFALQLRLPINLYLAALDFYFQLPPLAKDIYVGAGFELNVMVGGYAIITKYFGSAYLSLTQRVLLRDPYLDSEGRELTLNPQLSVGYRGQRSTLSAFLGYYRNLGDGFNVQYSLCDHSCVDPPGDVFNEHVAQFGVAVRF